MESGRIKLVKETAVVLPGVLMFVGAVSSLVMAIEFLRPIRHTNPFTG
jgi:hypothetical protein